MNQRTLADQVLGRLPLRDRRSCPDEQATSYLLECAIFYTLIEGAFLQRPMGSGGLVVSGETAP